VVRASAPGEYLEGLAPVKQESIPIINVERVRSEDTVLADAPAEGAGALGAGDR
jgi:hypothetical protein